MKSIIFSSEQMIFFTSLRPSSASSASTGEHTIALGDFVKKKQPLLTCSIAREADAFLSNSIIPL